jgi:hypothetical protein
MYDRAAHDEVGLLLECVDAAPTPQLAACAVLATASALVERGRVDEAVPLLDAVIARDDAAPVDYAWLHVQRARTRAEIGNSRFGVWPAPAYEDEKCLHALKSLPLIVDGARASANPD